MKNVLVTGASGQLGQCLRSLEKRYPNISFFFNDRSQLDITNREEVKGFFEKNHIDWCVNCAAYTAVDNAETDLEKAQSINVDAVRNLADISSENNVKIIHVSTDFVFDGTQNIAYTEESKVHPLNVYGKTKLEGEIQLQASNPKHFIVRTSWLYSEFNANFLKTMLRLSKSRDEISVVSDQIGTPTYAKDLAEALLEIISTESEAYGLYHYSNEGVASWYDFAKTIFNTCEIDIKVFPVDTSSYPTPAKRPKFSVLDKTKFKKTFSIDIPYWQDSLELAISNL
jgi:dTDP-4-dehydrorhamnose reductase